MLQERPVNRQARARGSKRLAFGPHSNGQTERANSVEESALSALKGLGCSLAMPQHQLRGTHCNGTEQGNPR